MDVDSSDSDDETRQPHFEHGDTIASDSESICGHGLRVNTSLSDPEADDIVIEEENAIHTKAEPLDEEYFVPRTSRILSTELELLRELRNERQHQTVVENEDDDDEVDDETFLQNIRDKLHTTDNSDQVNAVLDQYENQTFPTTPSVHKRADAPAGRVRPQRTTAGFRSTEVIVLDDDDEIISESIGGEEDKEGEEKTEFDQLIEVLGGEKELSIEMKKYARYSREVRRLQFSNPGAAFATQFLSRPLRQRPETPVQDEGENLASTTRTSRRAKVNTKGRLREETPRASSANSSSTQPEIIKPVVPVIYHNDSGDLVINGKVAAEDPCDCLEEGCTGCFFQCRKCGSMKCGHHCRRNRKRFIYGLVQGDHRHIEMYRLNPKIDAIKMEWQRVINAGKTTC